MVDIRVTGRSGKLCNQYLHKGSIVRLRGRITTEKRKNKQGTEYLKNFILAEHVEFRK